MSTVYYVNPNESATSYNFAKAWAHGSGWHMQRNPELARGPVAMFGQIKLMRLWREAEAQNRERFYCDHAYFGRKQFYRVTRNAMQPTDLKVPFGGVDSTRFEAQGVAVKPWRNDGSFILLTPQSDEFMSVVFGLSRQEWLDGVTHALRQYTDREIRVSAKAPMNAEAAFLQQLKGAHAVVGASSVAGMRAALEGVPCFSTAHGVSEWFGYGPNNLARIETPLKPSTDERFELACLLANNQWTLDEMKNDALGIMKYLRGKA